MEISKLITQLKTGKLYCPNCKSTSYVKNGLDKNVQRYKCKSCKCCFRDTNGTSFHFLRKKEQAYKYMNSLNSGLILRLAASQCGISIRTAFVWRHRFLKASSQAADNKQYSCHTVSLFQLPHSHKGSKKPPKEPLPAVKNLVCTGASVSCASILSGRTSISAALIASSAGCFYYLPCRQMPRSIPRLFKKTPVSSSAALVKADLLQWLAKFRGVATRYLSNYWHWRLLVQKLEASRNENRVCLESCLIIPQHFGSAQ
jgi:transposase-like protein